MGGVQVSAGSVPFSESNKRAYFNGAITGVAAVYATITAAAGKRLININGWASLSTGASSVAGGGNAALRLTYNDDTTETVTRSTASFGDSALFGTWGAARNFPDSAAPILNPFPSLDAKTIKKAEILLDSVATNPEGICTLTATEVPA